MKFNLLKFKLPKLEFKQNNSDVELTNRETDPRLVKDSTQFITNPKIIQLQTITSELEDIPAATTQEEGLKLPQQAPFDFSFNLPMPETYLPFVNVELITDLKLLEPSDFDETGAPLREIIGVGEFTYSSLKEISIKLYDWQGVTAVTAGAGQFGGFTNIPLSSPHVNLPAPTLEIPPPTDCYEQTVIWSTVSFPLIGSGINNIPTDATGTILFPGTPSETTLEAYTQNLADIWNIDSTQVLFGATENIDFIPDSEDFPVPFNPDNPDEFALPCGSDDPDEDSTPENPNQYWELQQIASFQDYVNIKGSYSEAKEVFEEFYPTVFITPEEDGPPYKAYTRVESTVVETARQNVQITQNKKDDYTVNVFGHFLLVSKAETETDFSDEDFPTFKPSVPEAKRPTITLKVFVNGHPVIQNQRKTHRNG